MVNPTAIEDEGSDEQLTKIVSYLDGELEDTQMNEVEHRLIRDEDLRSEADLLSRTWAMLDELEEVSASRQFTKDTLATIAAESDTDAAKTRRIGSQQVLRGLAKHRIIPCFLLGVLMGALGLAISHSGAQKRAQSGKASVSRMAIDNFDLLMNVEKYSAIPSAEDLMKLQLPDSGLDAGAEETLP